MPTYEYACQSCGTHIEVFQRFSEESLTGCGVCGGLLRKVFHPAGILFKGPGFYATDSRSKSKSSAGSRPASEDPSTAGGSGEGSSSAADAKTPKPGTTSKPKPETTSSSSDGAKERSA